jgi:hypothetical protein
MQFVIGQEVWFMNPRSVHQKVAFGKVSNFSGEHRFHFLEILDGWMKVNVQEALVPNAVLMMENWDAEHEKVKDAVGSPILWNQKYVKITT